MEDDVLKLKEVVSVTFDTTPFFYLLESVGRCITNRAPESELQ